VNNFINNYSNAKMDAIHNLDIESNNCKLVKLSKLKENKFKVNSDFETLNMNYKHYTGKNNSSKVDSEMDRIEKLSNTDSKIDNSNHLNGIIYYLESKLSQRDVEISNLKQDNEKLKLENKILRECNDELKDYSSQKSNELVQYKTKLEALNDLNDQLKNESNRYLVESIRDYQISLEKLNNQIALIHTDLLSKEKESKEQMYEVDLLKSLLKDLKTQRNNFEVLFLKKNQECENLEKSLTQFKLELLRNKLNINYVERKCEEKESEISKLSNEILGYTTHIKSLEKERIKIKTALAYNDEYIHKLETCWDQGLTIYEETKFELRKKTKELAQAYGLILELQKPDFN
jgi:chromosome segregation ATPase